MRIADGDSCWTWTAFLQPHPRGKGTTYGEFWVGTKGAGGRMAFAHRVAWELEGGPIPDGMRVLHRCDNPACVRPDHLFLGTQSDNMLDMFAKGRATRHKGSEHYGAKLTESAVAAIRAEYVPGSSRVNRGNARELAERFGVTRDTVTGVIKRGWKHVA